jgi:GT2 family glycosyltransferase
LHPGQVDAHFHLCLTRLLHYDACRPDGRQINGHLQMEANSAGVVDSRNEVVKEFLERFDDEWLWMIDSDMGFAPDTVEALVATADPKERPIVGGLCFVQWMPGNGADELGTPLDGYKYAATLFVEEEQGLRMMGPDEYPRDSLVEVAATGAACLLVHRSVFEKIHEAKILRGPHFWFQRPILNGREYGEDVTFCAVARQLGFPIIVDTAIKTSHKKTYYLTESIVDALTRQPVPA